MLFFSSLLALEALNLMINLVILLLFVIMRRNATAFVKAHMVMITRVVLVPAAIMMSLYDGGDDGDGDGDDDGDDGDSDDDHGDDHDVMMMMLMMMMTVKTTVTIKVMMAMTMTMVTMMIMGMIMT